MAFFKMDMKENIYIHGILKKLIDVEKCTVL
jgi:hypothetical protein